MSQFMLKALSGPVQGKTFRIKNGLRIGRTKGDVLLEDPSVSSLHAEINIYPNGKMMLSDKDSKNRILINEKTVIKSVLEKGSKFTIGKTEFEVVFMMTAEEILVQFMKKSFSSVKDSPVALKPFARAFELSFVSGLQKGQSYYVSYGPRFFGSESVDFPLFERSAPKKSFVVLPENNQARFVTKEPEIVCFNGKKIKKSLIQDGDYIVIGDTKLKFLFK